MTDPAPWRLDAAAAAFYEEHFVPALFGRWAPIVADAANLEPGQRVLDVGCGTGVLAREAQRRVQPTGHVIGVDASSGMLAAARKAAPAIVWQEADAVDLPFGDASFDAVLCQAALMFFEDRVGALREMRRVLLPGGALVVMTFGASAGYEALGALIEEVAGRETAEVFRAPFSLADVRTVTALVAEAGFGTVERETRSLPARFDSIEHLLRTEIDGWALRGRVDVATLRQHAADRLAGFVHADGTVEIPVEGHIATAWKDR